MKIMEEQYRKPYCKTCHRMETNKIRNQLIHISCLAILSMQKYGNMV